jgi:hypothetical protein
MTKKLGIMQPYFLPYIGYFQLINMVDEYVLYDNIQFTKKGWIHRNRMLQNGEVEYFTLPLKKDSDYLDIVDRNLTDDWENEKIKILRKIEANYRKTPQFQQFFPFVKSIFDYKNKNLFDFIYNSIKMMNEYLEIKTPIIVSSELPSSIKDIKSQDKVLAICKARSATEYINSSGGIELYDINEFKKQNIELKFYKAKEIQYQQFNNIFAPYLSILDVCMFCDKENVFNYLNEYEFLINQ